ncbi:MAG: MBL fold metallo-hydrolase [Candidatus Aminicenantia bacterium]
MRRLGNVENLKLILPEIAIENRASIFIGGKEIVLIYKGRAHTDGDLLVYFPSEKGIHTGDIVFNRIIPYIDYQGGSSTENWIKILEEIEKMDVEIVIPGHGEIGDKSILRAQAEYLRALREEVKKFVEKGFTIEDTI